MNTLSEYTYFSTSKNTTSYTFLLVFKIVVKSLKCILKVFCLRLFQCHSFYSTQVFLFFNSWHCAIAFSVVFEKIDLQFGEFVRYEVSFV